MISDYKMNPKGLAGRHTLAFPITTAVSQTAALFGAQTPGVRFQVTKVSVFCTAATATIAVGVEINGVSVITAGITPVAGTEVAGTLVSTLATLRGSATQQLQIKLTTNSTGAATNLVVFVQLRPYPSFGEIA